MAGPPTAAEAMHSSPLRLDEVEEYREKHKKSKKKKKKKDREKKHKHHKEKKRDKGERHVIDESPRRDASSMERTEDMTLIANQDSQSSLPGTSFQMQPSPKMGAAGPPSNLMPSTTVDGNDSSQDGFSFIDDDNSQPLPEHVLLYAGITTDNSPSCRPVSKPIVPIKTEEIPQDSPASSSVQSSSMGAATPSKVMGESSDVPAPAVVGGISPTKPLSEVSFFYCVYFMV